MLLLLLLLYILTQDAQLYLMNATLDNFQHNNNTILAYIVNLVKGFTCCTYILSKRQINITPTQEQFWKFLLIIFSVKFSESLNKKNYRFKVIYLRSVSLTETCNESQTLSFFHYIHYVL